MPYKRVSKINWGVDRIDGHVITGGAQGDQARYLYFDTRDFLIVPFRRLVKIDKKD